MLNHFPTVLILCSLFENLVGLKALGSLLNTPFRTKNITTITTATTNNTETDVPTPIAMAFCFRDPLSASENTKNCNC